MAKIEVNEIEARAYLELLKDAKLPAEMGYILTSLKYKILKAVQEELNLKSQQQVLEQLKANQNEEEEEEDEEL